MYNQAERLLFDLFSRKTITNEEILACINDGARISEVIEDSTILLELVDYLYEEEPIHVSSIIFLVESGANISFTREDGTCALTEAISLHQDVLTKKLLEKGANPNVIIEYHETLLDHAQFDLYYHECEGSDGEPRHLDWAKRMKNIIDSLLVYGAKNYRDLWTTNIGRWLQLFGCDPTGIVTEGGNIEPSNLSIEYNLKNRIEKWKEDYWDSWRNEFGPKPKEFNRENNNTEGLIIAKELLSQIPSLSHVRYCFIDAASESKGIRNVHHEVIRAT